MNEENYNNGDKIRQLFVTQAINKMFEIAGLEITFDDIKNWDTIKHKGVTWNEYYSMTDREKEKWKVWFLYEAGKQLKLQKYWAIREFNKFDSMWGLKLK